MLSAIDQNRLRISRSTSDEQKAALGQYLTPASVAGFMASLFPRASEPEARLLDAGAGIGSLSGAFIERWQNGEIESKSLGLAAYEIDPRLRKELKESLKQFGHLPGFKFEICQEDFVESAVNEIQFPVRPRFTHAILNPPYKKIGSASRYRQLLRVAGIETVNLYAGFVALSLELLAESGCLVAIIPRSFCNGPYYRRFREFILKRATIQRIHLFGSRQKAFRDDAVLQENIILVLQKKRRQGRVLISTSTDDEFRDLRLHKFDIGQIVLPDDPDSVIHIPASPDSNPLQESANVKYSLVDLKVAVSTGPVVDFRVNAHLRMDFGPGSAPLLYPCHFSKGVLNWPARSSKKPNAIVRNSETEKWLYPKGFYCVVKRFSSKEEKKRIVAHVVKPADFVGSEMLGFENHLNVFHEGKQGIPKDLAYGLAVFLSSTVVDEYFRRFSGHTQVNASDLRSLRYPARAQLMKLGKWAVARNRFCQEDVDERVDKLLT